MRVIPLRPEQVLYLRQLVLRPHQTTQECIWPKDNLSTTYHFGVEITQPESAQKESSQIICIGSFEKENSPHFSNQEQYRLRGMATHPDFRKRGAADLLIRHGEKHLQSMGVELLWFNARRVAYGFYEKLGFHYLGDEFEITGVGPHKVMWKVL